LVCQSILQDEGFEDDVRLDEAIKKLEYDLKRARKKEADGDDSVGACLLTILD
jgi:actin-related protein 5